MTTATNTTLPKGFEDSLLTLGLSLSRTEPQESPSKTSKAPYRFYCPTPETHAKVLHRLAHERARASSEGPFDSLADVFDEEQIVKNKVILRARDVVDIFGWSLPFHPSDAGHLTSDKHIISQLEPDSESPLFAEVQQAADAGGSGNAAQLFLPRVRFSNLYLPRVHPAAGASSKAAAASPRDKILYAHSAFPTHSEDSVFFGPDTYRFLDFLHDALGAIAPPQGNATWKLAVDVGTGAGAGALAVAGLNQSEGPARTQQQHAEGFLVDQVLGTDINPLALRFAAVNSQLYYRITAMADDEKVINGDQPFISAPSWQSRLQFRTGSLLDELKEQERETLDLVISNPPYIAFGKETGSQGASDAPEAKGATYADGGKGFGLALPLLILQQAIDKLNKGGVALLYTGVPVSLSGENPLWQGCQELVLQGKAKLEYWKVLDVDVFGDELQNARGAYGQSGVGRIEVVGVGLRKS